MKDPPQTINRTIDPRKKYLKFLADINPPFPFCDHKAADSLKSAAETAFAMSNPAEGLKFLACAIEDAADSARRESCTHNSRLAAGNMVVANEIARPEAPDSLKSALKTAFAMSRTVSFNEHVEVREIPSRHEEVRKAMVAALYEREHESDWKMDFSKKRVRISLKTMAEGKANAIRWVFFTEDEARKIISRQANLMRVVRDRGGGMATAAIKTRMTCTVTNKSESAYNEWTRRITTTAVPATFAPVCEKWNGIGANAIASLQEVVIETPQFQLEAASVVSEDEVSPVQALAPAGGAFNLLSDGNEETPALSETPPPEESAASSSSGFESGNGIDSRNSNGNGVTAAIDTSQVSSASGSGLHHQHIVPPAPSGLNVDQGGFVRQAQVFSSFFTGNNTSLDMDNGGGVSSDFQVASVNSTEDQGFEGATYGADDNSEASGSDDNESTAIARAPLEAEDSGEIPSPTNGNGNDNGVGNTNVTAAANPGAEAMAPRPNVYLCLRIINGLDLKEESTRDLLMKPHKESHQWLLDNNPTFKVDFEAMGDSFGEQVSYEPTKRAERSSINQLYSNAYRRRMGTMKKKLEESDMQYMLQKRHDKLRLIAASSDEARIHVALLSGAMESPNALGACYTSWDGKGELFSHSGKFQKDFRAIVNEIFTAATQFQSSAVAPPPPAASTAAPPNSDLDNKLRETLDAISKVSENVSKVSENADKSLQVAQTVGENADKSLQFAEKSLQVADKSLQVANIASENADKSLQVAKEARKDAGLSVQIATQANEKADKALAARRSKECITSEEDPFATKESAIVDKEDASAEDPFATKESTQAIVDKEDASEEDPESAIVAIVAKEDASEEDPVSTNESTQAIVDKEDASEEDPFATKESTKTIVYKETN
ncbi:MAG: hypothetical protein SGARI_000545, partial [Bacillariaceae sp.]